MEQVKHLCLLKPTVSLALMAFGETVYTDSDYSVNVETPASSSDFIYYSNKWRKIITPI